MGTFEIGNLKQKLENFFFSLIMGLIMGGFLSGLSHQRRPRRCVWVFKPTRGNCGYILNQIMQQKLENVFLSNSADHYWRIQFFLFFVGFITPAAH